MTAIVDIQLQRLRSLLADRKITLDITDAAMEWLGNKGYDPVYGARPLKRVIQRELQNPMAEQILSGHIVDNSIVKVDAKGDSLLIKPQAAKSSPKAA